MRQAALLVALACLVVAPLAGAAAGPAGAVDDTAAPSLASVSGPQLQTESLDREGVHIAVQLEEDGDAQWNVSATYTLEGRNETAAFDRLAAAFKAEETDNGFSVGVFETAAPAVSDRVGRSMEITDSRRAATTVDRGNNSTGLLSLQFRWTNFAAVNNETMTVDSFVGSWFGDLQDGQSLSIRAPKAYDPDTVEPTTTVVGGAYQWEGPQTFGEGEPSLVFTSSPVDEEGGLPMTAIGGVVVAVGTVGAVGVWLYRRSTGPSPGQPDPDNGDGGTGANPTASAESAQHAAAGGPSEGVEAGENDGNGGVSSTDAPEGGEPAGADGGGSGVDPELLSDEERVEQLLATNGGRMKQSKIVNETRWSTAKVSQLLSSMAEADRVEKLRIGRENLISLPGKGIDGRDDDGGGGG